MRAAEYDEALKRYPVPYESRMVDTSFGATHTLISGDENAPPLVLVHGISMNALFWLNIIAPLSNRYRVYSIELIGHSGKSAAKRLATRGSSIADWMTQTLDGLGLKQPLVVGMSLGGWVTLKLATCYPERVQRAVLWVPAGIIPPSTLKVVSQLIQAALRGQRGYENMMQNMAVHPIEPETLHFLGRCLGTASLLTTTIPTVLNDNELQRATMPLLFVVGSSDFFFAPDRVVERLKRVLPNPEIERLSDCDHLVNYDQPEKLLDRLFQFLDGQIQARGEGSVAERAPG